MPDMIIDAHAHLTDAPSADELAAVLSRAGEAGVRAVVTAAARSGDFEPVVSLLDRRRSPAGPLLFGALGFHPWHLPADLSGALTCLRAALSRLKRPLVGEIGLDFTPRALSAAPKEMQRAFFAAQLELADSLGLPAVIHACRTGGEVFAAVRPYRRIPAFLFHGCLEPVPRGAMTGRFFFSFSSAQTRPLRPKGRAAVRRLAEKAPERILPESDYPAGGREPAGTAETAAALEELGARPKEAAAIFLEKFGLLPLR